jgi:hypothetical protein
VTIADLMPPAPPSGDESGPTTATPPQIVRPEQKKG